MGRAPCCSKEGLHRGPWTAREDKLLINYVRAHGQGHWRSLPKKAGLLRCGKSCRLRWMNYLRPDIKRGNITPDEDDLIIRLHSLLGNRWSLIAGRLPGRTDNEIKNYWNSHLSKKLKNGTSSGTEEKCSSSEPRNKSTFKPNTDNIMKYHQESTNGENRKTKIHIPKAVRVSSLSVARTSSLFKGSGGCIYAGLDHGEEVYKLPWEWSGLEISDINDALPCWEDHQHNLAYDDVSSSEIYTPKNDEMWVEILEEYEQLLQTDNHAQLDSFIDSILL